MLRLLISPASWSLCDAGVGVFHASTRRFWEPEFEGSRRNLAAWAKALTGKATIAVGSVGLDHDFTEVSHSQEGTAATSAHIASLFDSPDRGDFDLVAVGVPFYQTPIGQTWCVQAIMPR